MICAPFSAMACILNHPLIDHRLATLRDSATDSVQFRAMIAAIGSLMVPEVTAAFGTREKTVCTPLEEMAGRCVARPIVLVPIMRAGLALLEGFHPLIPEASVGHVGVARDEQSLEPHSYYWNCPAHIDEAEVIVLDPMLATAGSAIWTISELKRRGAKHLHFACVVAAPEGVEAFEDAHADVPVTCAALDRELNGEGYIVPGLGDAGDRAFGTC